MGTGDCRAEQISRAKVMQAVSNCRPRTTGDAFLHPMIAKYKTLWIALGLFLIVAGITALALQLVGAQWAFLQFLETPGRLFSFVAKLLMVMAGFILLVVANTDWERERRESEGP